MSNVLSIMHGSTTESDFTPEHVSTMKRIIKFLHTGNMLDAKKHYQAAALIIDNEKSDSDPLWNEISIISALYMMGYEEGIRSERQKKESH